MRGSIVIWGLAGVVAVIVIGVLVFRSTTPDSEVTSIEVEGDPQVVEKARNGGGQLLMIQPEGLPPAGELDTTAGNVENARDKLEQKVTGPEVSGEPIAFTKVSITDTGFVPDELTVKAGTRVTFTNNGQALHWPASDDHPLHRLLPGFDAKKGLTTGEEYAFTFNKVGEWTYHDNLLPNLTGVVMVSL